MRSGQSINSIDFGFWIWDFGYVHRAPDIQHRTSFVFMIYDTAQSSYVFFGLYDFGRVGYNSDFRFLTFDFTVLGSCL